MKLRTRDTLVAVLVATALLILLPGINRAQSDGASVTPSFQCDRPDEYTFTGNDRGVRMHCTSPAGATLRTLTAEGDIYYSNGGASLNPEKDKKMFLFWFTGSKWGGGVLGASRLEKSRSVISLCLNYGGKLRDPGLKSVTKANGGFWVPGHWYHFFFTYDAIGGAATLVLTNEVRETFTLVKTTIPGPNHTVRDATGYYFAFGHQSDGAGLGSTKGWKIKNISLKFYE